MISLFGGKKKKDDKPKEKKSVVSEPVMSEEKPSQGLVFKEGSSSAVNILKGVYVSEKASFLTGFNQYVFKVARTTNKSEVAKCINRTFGVNVKKVRMINIPDKIKNIGRRQGVRQGCKKALVTLAEGETIAGIRQ